MKNAKLLQCFILTSLFTCATQQDYGQSTNAPVIVTGPPSQMATVGGTVTFSVVASGPGILTYQWMFNLFDNLFSEATNIVGATNASLTLTNVQLNQMGVYFVYVSNEYGSNYTGADLEVIDTDAIFLSGSTNSGINGWYVLNASATVTNSWLPYYTNAISCLWTNVANTGWYIDVGVLRYNGWIGFGLRNASFGCEGPLGLYQPTSSLGSNPSGPWSPVADCTSGDTNIIGSQSLPVIVIQPISDSTNLSLNITGPAASPWNVYSSSDLQNWTSVGSVTLDSSGTALFTINVISGVPCRFYRLGNASQ